MTRLTRFTSFSYSYVWLVLIDIMMGLDQRVSNIIETLALVSAYRKEFVFETAHSDLTLCFPVSLP